MFLSTREQYDQCLKVDPDGYFYAIFNNLTLTSVYQPIFDQNLELVGLEALVRIQNQDQEILRPDLFFSSKTNDCFVRGNVERLSRAMHIRNFHRIGLSNITLFLNVLPAEKSDSSIRGIANGLLIQRLGELGIGCSRIVLEIVEQHANNDGLKTLTDELKTQGFQIAMDDFGKDASDTTRAAAIKPHIIKIDRSLLNEYMEGNHQGLVEGLKLAYEMDAKIVIEGIETKTQLDIMQGLGVDMYQGYYLAKPCSADAIKRMFTPLSCKRFEQTAQV